MMIGTRMPYKSIDTKAVPAASQMEHLEVTIEGLKANLDNAVEVAFLRGATEWVRLNYPSHYERLLMRFDSSALFGHRGYLH